MILAALSVTAVLASIASYLVDGGLGEVLTNGGWTLGALVAVVGVGAALRACPLSDSAAWFMLLFAAAAWFVGQCAWDIYAVTSYPGSPNIADFLWFAFAGLTALGVHRFGGVNRRRQLSWLEITPLVVAVCSLITATMWDEIQRSALPSSAIASALAYPVVYVVATVVMLQSILVGGLSAISNRGIWVMFVGLLFTALAFILWTPKLLAATYVSGTSALDLLWTLGIILFGLGAAVQTHAERPIDTSLGDRRAGVLPSLTFFGVAIFQVVYCATHGAGFGSVVLSAGVLIIGGSLAARGAVLRREQMATRRRLMSSEEQLREANERLSVESRRDPLTGLGNRLRLNEDLDAIVARSFRHEEPYAIAIFDIDRFKAYNDTYGHQAGDVALATVAEIFDQHARGEDRLYRYGGEEMLVLLSGADSDAAWSVAERLRAAVASAVVPHAENIPYGILTASGGVAAAQPGEDADSVIARADAALYEAKARGRNQVVGPAAVLS